MGDTWEVQITVKDSTPYVQNNEWTDPSIPQYSRTKAQASETVAI